MKTGVFLLVCIIVSGALIFVSLLSAYNNGTGDMDMPTPSGGCSNGFGCHFAFDPNVKLILTSEADDGQWNTVEEAGVIICTLNIDSTNSDADIAGAMLLSSLGDNIKDDGWTILNDPNSNPTPYNYNERFCPSGDYVFSWSVTAPAAPGNYQVKARLLHDNSGAAYDTSFVLSFNFSTGVLENEALFKPNTYNLFSNYPNPFYESTNIQYTIPKEGKVVLTIYDISGRVVHILVNMEQKMGFHQAHWDGRNTSGVRVTTGIYFYRLSTGKFVATRKLIFVEQPNACPP
ncbi:MAG: T9SS type A sorting domain-containing protein [Candidatus Cloacimonadota bacterium]|nr:MAG: T9SS type A sorting domain-containing protein [Candidatus Cloacimonadota bacterium]